MIEEIMNEEYIVLIASHLGSEARYTTIKWALQSLANQTRLPDKVLISYSYNQKIGLPNTLEWSEILGIIPHKFYCYRQQTMQFVHYYRLFRFVKNENAILMFLDDDDLYHQDKIKEISTVFELNKNVEAVSHYLITFGSGYDGVLTTPFNTEKSLLRNSERIEYCCYAIKSNCIGKITKYISDNSTHNPKYRFYDINFMTGIKNTCVIKELNKTLLFVRQDNHQRDWLLY